MKKDLGLVHLVRTPGRQQCAQHERWEGCDSGGRAEKLSFVLDQVARLTVQRAAQRVERGKPNSSRLAGFEDREVCQRDANSLAQLGKCDPTLLEKPVQRYLNRQSNHQRLLSFELGAATEDLGQCNED
jgi:hypothetical protein